MPDSPSGGAEFVLLPSDNVPNVPSGNVLLKGHPGGVRNQGQLLMTQRERDRLVALKKADKKLKVRG